MPPPRTLVTGANGFFAAHVIAAAIDAGHTVLGSVRSSSSGDALLSIHPDWRPHLSFVEIKDYTAPGAWDDVFRNEDIDYVIHVAAPMVDDQRLTDYMRDFERPGVETNKQLFQSAARFGSKTVKSIVVTGTMNAVTLGSPDELRDRVLKNDDWNSLTTHQATTSTEPYIRYCASRKASELAIWDLVSTSSPPLPFNVTVLLPPLILGPPIHAGRSLRSLNFSTQIIYDIFSGKNNQVVPRTPFPGYIDARDLALAHIRCLTSPKAANRRLLVGRAISFNEIAGILRRDDGVMISAGRIGRDQNEEEDGEEVLELKVDSGPFWEAMREDKGDDDDEEGKKNKKKRMPPFRYREKEETVRDIVRKLLEMERMEGKE